MVRNVVGVIAGVVVLALAIGLRGQYIGRHREFPRSPNPQDIVGPVSSPKTTPAQAVSARKGSIGLAWAETSSPAESKVHIVSREKTMKGAALFDTEFQVSASVEANCRVGIARGYGTACNRIRHDLSMMAQESRDPAWASDLEAKLQNYFERQNLEGFSVRNIECRTSLCAIEVVATKDQPIVFVFASPNPLSDQLIPPTYFANGEETDPPGAKLQTLLVTYRRR
jgi:hypothetical protein